LQSFLLKQPGAFALTGRHHTPENLAAGCCCCADVCAHGRFARRVRRVRSAVSRAAGNKNFSASAASGAMPRSMRLASCAAANACAGRDAPPRRPRRRAPLTTRRPPPAAASAGPPRAPNRPAPPRASAFACAWSGCATKLSRPAASALASARELTPRPASSTRANAISTAKACCAMPPARTAARSASASNPVHAVTRRRCCAPSAAAVAASLLWAKSASCCRTQLPAPSATTGAIHPPPR